MFFRRRKNPVVNADGTIAVDPTRTIKKRQPKNKNPAHKLYFNHETQEAIVAYQKSDCRITRVDLYMTKILPAFEKLVENLINIHKFTGLHDSYEDLKNDCVNFLFETIGKFDDTRGTNAFSYFNVVAKNWLIIRTKQKMIIARRNVSLEDIDSMTLTELKTLEDYDLIQANDCDVNFELSSCVILVSLKEIRCEAKSPQELICINSIITIFENISELDMLNKSAVLMYMRELTGLTPKQLTLTMQSIRKYYRKQKADKKSLDNQRALEDCRLLSSS